MTSVDANLLLFSFCPRSPFHRGSQAFLVEMSSRHDVALSEFVLTEFYLHLRNPAVLDRPLSAEAAVAVIQSYRRHSQWKIIGFPPASLRIHEALWTAAGKRDFARRRIFDARTAMTLRSLGVSQFATTNVKDFEGFGFDRVWNPLVEKP